MVVWDHRRDRSKTEEADRMSLHVNRSNRSLTHKFSSPNASAAKAAALKAASQAPIIPPQPKIKSKNKRKRLDDDDDDMESIGMYLLLRQDRYRF